MSVTDTIEAEGHLIDSGLLSAIFDKIIEVRGSYEIITFDIGKTNDDASRIQMRVTVSDEATLDDLFQQLTTFGAHAVREANAVLKPAEKDRCVPDDFYSTTNHQHARAPQGPLGRGRQAADGRRHRRRRHVSDVPKTAGCEGR